MSHLQARTIFVCNVTVLILRSQTFTCFYIDVIYSIIIGGSIIIIIIIIMYFNLLYYNWSFNYNNYNYNYYNLL